MKLPILYKLTKKNQIQTWQIQCKDDEFWTDEGLLDGAITKSMPTKCLPKNEGKKNATTGAEQAVKEIEAKYKKKLENSYYEDVEEARGGVKSFYEPMLAENFNDHKETVVYPVYSQPKLDGCLSSETKITTDKGVRSLGEIVENRLKCKVLSFNLKTRKQEYKNILNWAKNGIDINAPSAEWYKITLANGKEIKATGNHLFYLSKLKCWRRADELTEDDSLMLEK